jgi:Hint module
MTSYTNGACSNSTIFTLSAATASSTVSKACFAGSETVTVESVGTRFLSEIRTGDRVLAADAAGQTFYSDVVFVPHGPNKDSALFVHITTANGRDIKMTESHILPSGACDTASSLPLVYAKNVHVGDCIMTVSGEERVSAVGVVPGQGLYTIVTKEEYVVVNGIIASPFATNHMLANLYYNMHRFIYSTAPALLSTSLLRSTNEVSSSSVLIQHLELCSYRFIRPCALLHFKLESFNTLGSWTSDPFLRVFDLVRRPFLRLFDLVRRDVTVDETRLD